MRFLLDTNAFSEVVRAKPDAALIEWLGQVNEDDLFISVLTVGEIKRGVQVLPAGARRQTVSEATSQLLADYADRVLPIDLPIADQWAYLAARYKAPGVIVGVVDELITATALHHNLVVVTRNARHFEHSGCELLSPWSG